MISKLILNRIDYPEGSEGRKITILFTDKTEQDKDTILEMLRENEQTFIVIAAWAPSGVDRMFMTPILFDDTEEGQRWFGLSGAKHRLEQLSRTV